MTMRTRSGILVWVERLLLTAGVILAAWAILVATEARFFRSLPAPGPRHGVARLPGEGADAGNVPTGTSGRGTVRTGEWVARLDAPSLELSAPVLEGSDDGTLARAAGHIEDTAFPGDSGNVGIAGHRDTIFRPLRNVKRGDPITLTTGDGVYEYHVTSTRIVEPEDVYVLDPTARPTLTLVTCYPFSFIGHAPQRFIVRAELVSLQPR